MKQKARSRSGPDRCLRPRGSETPGTRAAVCACSNAARSERGTTKHRPTPRRVSWYAEQALGPGFKVRRIVGGDEGAPDSFRPTSLPLRNHSLTLWAPRFASAVRSAVRSATVRSRSRPAHRGDEEPDDRQQPHQRQDHGDYPGPPHWNRAGRRTATAATARAASRACWRPIPKASGPRLPSKSPAFRNRKPSTRAARCNSAGPRRRAGRARTLAPRSRGWGTPQACGPAPGQRRPATEHPRRAAQRGRRREALLRRSRDGGETNRARRRERTASRRTGVRRAHACGGPNGRGLTGRKREPHPQFAGQIIGQCEDRRLADPENERFHGWSGCW